MNVSVVFRKDNCKDVILLTGLVTNLLFSSKMFILDLERIASNSESDVCIKHVNIPVSSGFCALPTLLILHESVA